jgi:hypothetical protein
LFLPNFSLEVFRGFDASELLYRSLDLEKIQRPIISDLPGCVMYEPPAIQFDLVLPEGVVIDLVAVIGVISTAIGFDGKLSIITKNNKIEIIPVTFNNDLPLAFSKDPVLLQCLLESVLQRTSIKEIIDLFGFPEITDFVLFLFAEHFPPW